MPNYEIYTPTADEQAGYGNMSYRDRSGRYRRKRSTLRRKRRTRRRKSHKKFRLQNKHITPSLFQHLSKAELVKIRDAAARKQRQSGGGIGSFFNHVKRIAHKVLTSKLTGHVIRHVTNYRNRHMTDQGGSGLFSFITKAAKFVLPVLLKTLDL